MDNRFNFIVSKKKSKNLARTGILHTPHGDIKTPAFVTVGTKGTVKSLTPEDIHSLNTQFIFVNTYHMVLSPGLDILKQVGGIRKLSHIDKPLITDSGGFQVFSLGTSRKIAFRKSDKEKGTLVKIDEEGVLFKSPVDGREFYFNPEFSINAQRIIGADFMVSFDECVSAGASYQYTLKAMERTHRWAERGIAEFNKQRITMNFTSSELEQSSGTQTSTFSENPVNPLSLGEDQRLYGVIQGGQFEDLRKTSAKFIASLPFFGLAIGGVSVGESKEEMRKQVSWVMDVLKDDPRPRHLLGIGEIDDVIEAVEMGMDTMDCVTPTRHARMGRLYVPGGLDNPKKLHEIDILKLAYKASEESVDRSCSCYTCTHFNRSYLHHLFKERELLGYHLATIHNLTFMENLFEEMRQAIEDDAFDVLKKKWLG